MLVRFLSFICSVLIFNIFSVVFTCSRDKIKSEFISRLLHSVVFGFAITIGILAPDMLPTSIHPLLISMFVTISIIIIGQLLLAFASKKIIK